MLSYIYNKTSINKINQLQLRVGKVILNLPKKSNSKNILSELQLLTFNQRCQYHAAMLVYKTVNNLAPSYMYELIILAENGFYNLRSKTHKDLLLSYTPRTRYFKDTFQYYAMKIWNSIPIEIRKNENIKSFKTNYKTYLLNMNV